MTYRERERELTYAKNQAFNSTKNEFRWSVPISECFVQDAQLSQRDRAAGGRYSYSFRQK